MFIYGIGFVCVIENLKFGYKSYPKDLFIVNEFIYQGSNTLVFM